MLKIWYRRCNIKAFSPDLQLTKWFTTLAKLIHVN